jgi:hypothetical protein
MKDQRLIVIDSIYCILKKNGTVYRADLTKASHDPKRVGVYIGKMIDGKLNTLINET